MEVIEGDALKIDLSALLSPGGRIVGNLPYAISSPLLRRFLDLRDRASDLNVLLQKEVADRMAATAGSKDYGILSVLYGIWASTSIPLRFGPGCFEPPPRVDSALFEARFRSQPDSPVPPFAVLEPLLKRAFAQRRKTLENNLRGRYPNLKQHLRLLNIVGSRRAETLSVDEFVRLGLAIASRRVRMSPELGNAVRLIPLGGLGEFGLNSMLVEWGDSRLLVDAGMMFPHGNLPGIDSIVPDFEALKTGPALRGIILTHGHEDHLGGLPFAIKSAPARVYGSRYTLALARRRLRERDVSCDLNEPPQVSRSSWVHSVCTRWRWLIPYPRAAGS